MTYKRTLSELEKHAIKWWPDELKKAAAKASVIPTLLETQEDFLAVLKLSGGHPNKVFDVLEACGMPANLFLKHLVVLSDYGGEKLKRLSGEFENVFQYSEEESAHSMNFAFEEQLYDYTFSVLPSGKKLSNPNLNLDSKGLLKAQPLSDYYRDVIMIILHGSTASDITGGGLERCEVGTLLGKKAILQEYVKEKYIHVSRITGGATANEQGQIAENNIIQFLKENLSEEYSFSRGAIKMKNYPKASGMPFDIIVSRGSKKVGIEISFQVTTNSTIERKAALAEDRQRLMRDAGFSIAYVLDGAGNFERKSAAERICKFSDCTVAYSISEFKLLVDFIKARLK
mgnify:CR=1 FL=1